MRLYPLKFKPIFKERLWGGKELEARLNKKIPTSTTGESWEVSGVEGSVSVVSEGAFRGVSLQEILEKYPKELMGERLMKLFPKEFPVLIKFIDARDDLSIQVHPNDEQAQRMHQSKGKTEMWVIMHHEPEAKLIIGFEHPMNKEQLCHHLENDTLTQVLHYQKVQKGDAFFIPSGTIHAIGAGIVLAEIQQTSDVTYRVYDFNRKDKNGQLRELHTALALEVMDFEQGKALQQLYEKKPNTPNKIVSCPYFTTNYIHTQKSCSHTFTTTDSFRIYMCLAGGGYFITEANRYSIEVGETILIPACVKDLSFEGTDSELLEIYM